MKEFEIEDVAYFANGSGQLIKGVVIHKFKHYCQTLYVLEVSTSIDPYYEVRHMSTLSDTPEGPLFWMRKLLGKENK